MIEPVSSSVALATVWTLPEASSEAAATVPVLAHVCGTERDPQGLAKQERTLREAGALLLPTNAALAVGPDIDYGIYEETDDTGTRREYLIADLGSLAQLHRLADTFTLRYPPTMKIAELGFSGDIGVNYPVATGTQQC